MCVCVCVCVCVCPITQTHMTNNFKNEFSISIKLNIYIRYGNDPVPTFSGDVGICMKSIKKLFIFVSSGWVVSLLITRLGRMEFPSLINWTSSYRF